MTSKLGAFGNPRDEGPPLLACRESGGDLLAAWRCPVYWWRELVGGAGMEQENLSSRYRRPGDMGEGSPLVARGRVARGDNRKRQSTDARHRGGPARSSAEGLVTGPE